MLSTTTTAEGNVGIALALVCGAGAATAIGASVVFLPSLVKLTSRRVLAASLGLSAGVMTYVSFVEIFQKCIIGFISSLVNLDTMTKEEVIEKENLAYIYATLSFFGGVAVMLIIDVLVRCFSGEHTPHHHDYNQNSTIIANTNGANNFAVPHCVGCSDDPVAELNEWQQRAEQELRGLQQKQRDDTNTNTGASCCCDDETNSGGSSMKDQDGNKSDKLENNIHLVTINGGTDEQSNNRVVVENAPKESSDAHQYEQRKLVKMGVSTAVAIALHNFPEGLATFVAALDDPSVGAVLAVAIGIHNIPEGLCVGLPIYYATGNRWKAFMWGCLSGLSEPFAALLGWAVLARAMSDQVYAILFGLVSGMMVIISLKELIPTAHRYDPEDSVVTYSLIAGMAIIALSLVLFKL